jgi:hypothetical protein
MVKTIEEADRNYTQRSMETFLKGEQTEGWIVGILRASSPENIQDALQYFSSYAGTRRYEFLKKTLGAV